MAKKDNYVRKRDLHADIMTSIDGSNEPKYIILEVLKMCASEVKSRKREN